MRLLFIIFVWYVLLPQTADAHFAEVFDITDQTSVVDVDAQPYFDVLEDPQAKVEFADVLARQAEFKKFVFSDQTTFGYSKAHVWYRFQIKNSEPATRLLYLEASDPLEYLDLFTMDATGQKMESVEQVGSWRPLSQQHFRYRFPVLELRVQPGLNTYYLRNSAIAITFPFHFWTGDELTEKGWRDKLILSFIMASFCVMAIYNLLLGISTRRQEYFLYFGYLAFFIIFQMFLTGAGPLTFGDIWAKVNKGWVVWNACLIFFLIQFSLKFLSLKRTMPKLWWFGIGMSCYAVGLGILSLWSRQNSLNLLPFMVPTMLILIYAGIRRSIDGFKPANYYVLGWTGLLFGASFSLAYYLGMIGNSFFVNWATPFGAALQMIFLSLAIGERLRYEINAHVEGQARLLESYQQEVNSREHAFHQLGKVFYPHQLEIMQRGEDLESTMPTGPGRACIIQLDVINSSLIRHVNRKEFFIDFFKLCHELMIENYSAEKMSSNAYRIKEMGDGFLCSVGYPFICPEHGNIAVKSVSLALEFIQTFRECAEKLQYPDPIYCSIGIAAGEIEGFFPNTGTKEYDLYGQGIILANRYEGMRKSLFETVDFDILIIQEEVFKSLPPEMRSGFQEVDLIARGLKVRDDPVARLLYYQIVETKALLLSA